LLILRPQLIDFGKFLNGAEKERREAAAAILNGFQTAGFIYLKNVPISSETLAQTFSMSAKFFDLPIETKLAYGWTTPEANRGYSAPGREKVSQLTDKDEVEKIRKSTPDLKESYEVGLEGEPDHPNQWPREEDAIVGFRGMMLDFFDKCKAVHAEVMRAIAVGMGLDDGFFDSFVDHGDNTLRLLHYPAVDADVFKTDAVRAGAHSDYGSITLSVFPRPGLPRRPHCSTP
jgi:isopenicillin N synthase-like dioxygenase